MKKASIAVSCWKAGIIKLCVKTVKENDKYIVQ